LHQKQHTTHKAMEKFTLYLGLNDKDTKKQEIATADAYKVVSKLIADDFDGGTIYEARGIYRHDSGAVVEEKTLRIELLFTTFEKVKNLVSTLKNAFNQESIAVQREQITSELM